jgi:hypothetical protein
MRFVCTYLRFHRFTTLRELLKTLSSTCNILCSSYLRIYRSSTNCFVRSSLARSRLLLLPEHSLLPSILSHLSWEELVRCSKVCKQVSEPLQFISSKFLVLIRAMKLKVCPKPCSSGTLPPTIPTAYGVDLCQTSGPRTLSSGLTQVMCPRMCHGQRVLKSTISQLPTRNQAAHQLRGINEPSTE